MSFCTLTDPGVADSPLEDSTMRAVALSFLVVLFLGVAFGQDKTSDQPPIPPDKWNLEYADKTWGLKMKSVSYSTERKSYTFVVEFSKDLNPDELRVVRAAFPARDSGESKILVFYFFDKDNVVLTKQARFDTTTELTGVKG